MKKFYFILCMAILAKASSGQNNFMIYSFKGTVTVNDAGTSGPAKIGKMLSNAASVNVGAASVVTLICNQANMFTISKSGNYAMTRYNDSCKIKANSVSANYVKYFWDQMTAKDEGTPGSNRKAFMNTVGAVSRSVNDIWIDTRLDTINFVSGDFTLRWKSYSEAKEFTFMLYNSTDISTPAFTSNLLKQKVQISDFKKLMTVGKSYYWTASVKGGENDELKVINYVSKETLDNLVSNLKSKAGGFEAPAEQAYRLGFMLEDAHYLADAYQYYQQAANLDSSNVLFRSTLMSFKKDYELK
jgi:hypothetical protein